MHGAAAFLVLGAVLIGASGCVAEKPEREPPPRQPAEVRVSDMFVALQRPTDSDGNGYLDTLETTIYLFGDRFEAASIFLPGSFRFTLLGEDGRIVGEWMIDSTAAREAAVLFSPGPGYQISVNLLDVGTDVMPPQSADLLVTFTASSGEAVRKRNSVRLGPTGL